MGTLVNAALIIAAGIICAVVLSILYGWLKKRADQTRSKLDDILLLAIGRPTIILILFLSVYLAVYNFIDVPAEYSWILHSNPSIWRTYAIVA